MGDKKPKKTSSGNNAAFKAKQVKNQATKDAAAPRSDEKGKDKRK